MTSSSPVTPRGQTDEHATQVQGRLPLSVNVGSLLVFVGLIVVLAVTQWVVIPRMDKLSKEAEQKSTEASTGDEGGAPHEPEAVFELPDPVGPEDAPVKIVSYLATDNSCHENTSWTLADVANAYKGKVRLEFVDMASKEGRKEADALGIACDSGLVINGKTELTIGTGKKTRKVRFFGPIDEHEYGMADLCAAIDYLLSHPQAATAKKAQAGGTGAQHEAHAGS